MILFEIWGLMYTAVACAGACARTYGVPVLETYGPIGTTCAGILCSSVLQNFFPLIAVDLWKYITVVTYPIKHAATAFRKENHSCIRMHLNDSKTM